jgi:hypothetical protein
LHISKIAYSSIVPDEQIVTVLLSMLFASFRVNETSSIDSAFNLTENGLDECQ